MPSFTSLDKQVMLYPVLILPWCNKTSRSMNLWIIFNIKDTSKTPTPMVVNSLLISFLIPDCPYISHTTSNLCFLNKLPEFITNEFLKIMKVVLIVRLPISLKV